MSTISLIQLVAGIKWHRAGCADQATNDAFWAIECASRSCCCTVCCGWPCCPGSMGVVDLIVQRIPQPPTHITLGMEPKDFVTLDEYDAMVQKESNPPEFVRKIRPIDGHGNNAKYPWLGQAGRPYGISSFSKNPVPKDLPDPAQVVDDLFLRKKFEPAPADTNALVVWIAVFVIHDFFRSDEGRGQTNASDPPRPWINVNSSYLDLQPLYGHNEETSNSIRTFQGGQLKPDAVGDSRMSVFPAAKALAILMSREHNYIAQQLAERCPEQFPDDESLFHQARLINIGVYINMIGRDYAGGISGMYRDDGEPLVVIPAIRNAKNLAPKGFLSTWEFNFIYRFHATVPEYYGMEHVLSAPNRSIEEILEEAFDSPSGRFGGLHMPIEQLPRAELKKLEVETIEKCRRLGMGTMNSFRNLMGFPSYKAFEEMSDLPEVVEGLRKHYKSAEDVELYVGLMTEKAKKGGWGVSQTIGLAILADALACIRHDRFQTTDFTAEIYTAWGLRHAESTSMVDLINRHTSMDLPRSTPLGRLRSQWPAERNRAGHSRVAPQDQTMSR